MPPRPPRDPAKVGSFSELRSHYKELWKELDECNRMKGATNAILRDRTGEVRGAKADAKADAAKHFSGDSDTPKTAKTMTVAALQAAKQKRGNNGRFC